MPQLNYQLDPSPAPLAVLHAVGTAVRVVATTSFSVTWADGTTTTIAQGSVAITASAGITTANNGADLYLVVVQQGLTTMTLLKLSDFGSIEQILEGDSWGIIGELTPNRVREHQQNADSASIPINSGNGGSTYLRGDILYYDLGPSGWRPRHIGNEGDTLTTVNGVPVWQGLIINGTPATTNTTIQTSDTGVHGAKALIITPFSPPANWYTTGFNDSAWPLARISPDGGGFITASTSEGPNGQVLFRVPFTLGGGQTTNLNLIIQDDSQYEAIYINGIFLAGPSALFPNDMPPTTIAIPSTSLTTGSNLLAVWSINDSDSGSPEQFGGIRYSIQQATTTIPPSAIPTTAVTSVNWDHNDTLVSTQPTGSFNDTTSVTVSASTTGTTVDYSFTVSGIGNTPINTTPTLVKNTNDATTITAKVFNVSGSPPANWYTTGFNDSAWPTALHSGAGPNYIVSPTPEGAFGILLFRDRFNVDLTSVDHVTISIKADDHLLALYVNGNPQTIISISPGSYASYVIPRTDLANGDNVIAVENVNDNDPFGGIGYNISTNTSQIPQPLTLPQGVAEGSVMIFQSGSWVGLPPGTVGQVLTMGSTYPHWV